MKKFFTRIILPICIIALTLGGITAYRYIAELQSDISQKFNGQMWALPAIVYSSPLEIYPGLKLDPDLFEKELLIGGYRKETTVHSSGGYNRTASFFHLVTRPFTYPEGKEPSQNVTIQFSNNTVSSIRSGTDNSDVPFVRLDPARIGSFHPLEHEDRLVLNSVDIPPLLKQSLIAVEDRNFYTHHGVSIKGITRALLANIQAGRTVQGGSTITQQLVKNFFLNREQTLKRKIHEAIMAILLDYQFPKEDIMTAYINEIFLGQDGRRAIHGFGLASQFYFRRDIMDLSVAQTATLVGMVKGPSVFDPRRNPDNALARRQKVLEILYQEDVIDKDALVSAQQEPLTDVAPQTIGLYRFPAFLDLVKRQLREEYREEDLNSNGLQIISTLDPIVQIKLEEELSTTVASLEQSYNLDQVEGAAVITDKDSGEVEAITGGKEPGFSGFNRALDAKRPVGSLLKPAVYLTAIEQGYTLASPLLDQKIALENEGKQWRPQNYDRREHGQVPLYLALAKSYNLATVRLGLNVGLENVINTIHRLGYPEQIKAYPSLLLGGISMTPLQITQMYQTIGSGGFYQPLRCIRSVMDAKGKLVNRYGLEVEQRFTPQDIFLLHHGLQLVMEEGTGRRLDTHQNIILAGKTGTSDNLRDSWFAGFTPDRLAVVWLGKDDNSPLSLTGSTGALKVWGSIVANLDYTSSEPVEPENLVWRRIDKTTLRPTNLFNRDSIRLPFKIGHEPKTYTESKRPPQISLPDIETELHEVEKEARKIIKSLNDLFK